MLPQPMPAPAPQPLADREALNFFLFLENNRPGAVYTDQTIYLCRRRAAGSRAETITMMIPEVLPHPVNHYDATEYMPLLAQQQRSKTQDYGNLRLINLAELKALEHLRHCPEAQKILEQLPKGAKLWTDQIDDDKHQAAVRRVGGKWFNPTEHRPRDEKHYAIAVRRVPAPPFVRGLGLMFE